MERVDIVVMVIIVIVDVNLDNPIWINQKFQIAKKQNPNKFQFFKSQIPNCTLFRYQKFVFFDIGFCYLFDNCYLLFYAKCFSGFTLSVMFPKPVQCKAYQ